MLSSLVTWTMIQFDMMNSNTYPFFSWIFLETDLNYRFSLSLLAVAPKTSRKKFDFFLFPSFLKTKIYIYHNGKKQKHEKKGIIVFDSKCMFKRETTLFFYYNQPTAKGKLFLYIYISWTIQKLMNFLYSSTRSYL